MKLADAKTIALPFLALALMSAACGGKDNPPPKAPEAAQPATTTTNADARKTDQVVNIEKDVRMICNIDDSEKSPKFDFDSTSLSGADRDVLQQLAKCMTEGPLKGKNVQLIGRADARGEQEYNMGLGGSRAQAAKTYLTSLGVGAERLSETSRGELDATGKDEEGWRKDRRVDVKLAK